MSYHKTAMQRSKPSAPLHWVLEQELVSSAIIGPRTVEQLEGNWEAIEHQVPVELLEELDERTAPHETYLDFMQGKVTLQRIHFFKSYNLASRCHVPFSSKP